MFNIRCFISTILVRSNIEDMSNEIVEIKTTSDIDDTCDHCPHGLVGDLDYLDYTCWIPDGYLDDYLDDS